MQDLLNLYAPISLEDMREIRLMNRIDTKFVTTVPVLLQLLEMAKDDYWAQEIDGERNLAYQTTYFDTLDYNMYYVHQSGHTNRQKLRFRTYVSSNLQFMEVKTKNNHGRTKKKRMKVVDTDITDSEKLNFLQEHLRYNPDELRPAIANSFNRITLVNKGKTERLTIDTDLQFNNLVTGTKRNMGKLVIVELKRDGLFASFVCSLMGSASIAWGRR